MELEKMLENAQVAIIDSVTNKAQDIPENYLDDFLAVNEFYYEYRPDLQQYILVDCQDKSHFYELGSTFSDIVQSLNEIVEDTDYFKDEECEGWYADFTLLNHKLLGNKLATK